MGRRPPVAAPGLPEKDEENAPASAEAAGAASRARQRGRNSISAVVTPGSRMTRSRSAISVADQQSDPVPPRADEKHAEKRTRKGNKRGASKDPHPAKRRKRRGDEQEEAEIIEEQEEGGEELNEDGGDSDSDSDFRASEEDEEGEKGVPAVEEGGLVPDSEEERG
eukprot:jgi/Mesen1/10101/ME000074S09436